MTTRARQRGHASRTHALEVTQLLRAVDSLDCWQVQCRGRFEEGGLFVFLFLVDALPGHALYPTILFESSMLVVSLLNRERMKKRTDVRKNKLVQRCIPLIYTALSAIAINIPSAPMFPSRCPTHTTPHKPLTPRVELRNETSDTSKC